MPFWNGNCPRIGTSSRVGRASARRFVFMTDFAPFLDSKLSGEGLPNNSTNSSALSVASSECTHSRAVNLNLPGCSVRKKRQKEPNVGRPNAAPLGVEPGHK